MAGNFPGGTNHGDWTLISAKTEGVCPGIL